MMDYRFIWYGERKQRKTVMTVKGSASAVLRLAKELERTVEPKLKKEEASERFYQRILCNFNIC